MRSSFSIFQSHLDFAHSHWSKYVNPGNLVIDATCGNGHDTLFLARLLKGFGKVVAYDVQQEALQKTNFLLKQKLNEDEYKSVHLKLACHSEMSEQDANLIVYNLGYLPGSDKLITTQKETTLKSVQRALKILSKGGVISITCYPGHPAGREELEMLMNFFPSLPPLSWSVSCHQWLNRKDSPLLLLLQRSNH